MIEAGRHQNIDRILLFCQIGLKRNVYIVEDEFHFFIVCPTYDAIRELNIIPEWKILLQANIHFIILCQVMLSQIFYQFPNIY